MSCLCPLLFIKRTRLKVDADDQRRFDLRQSNRKIGLILRVYPVPLWRMWRQRGCLGLGGATMRSGLDHFSKSRLHLPPPTYRVHGSHCFNCWGRMVRIRTYKRLLQGGLFVLIEPFLNH